MVRILLFYRRYLSLGLFLCLGLTGLSQSVSCDTTKNGIKVLCSVKDSNGFVTEIRRYRDGQKHGNWDKFNKKGELVTRNTYKKGKRVWTFNYRDEEVIQSINKKGKIRNFKGCGCGS